MISLTGGKPILVTMGTSWQSLEHTNVGMQSIYEIKGSWDTSTRLKCDIRIMQKRFKAVGVNPKTTISPKSKNKTMAQMLFTDPSK